MKNQELNDIYLDYIKTEKQQSFNTIYNYMYNLLYGVYKGNTLFNTYDGKYIFDDVYQDTIIKLLTLKQPYDVNKSGINTFISVIFRNTMLDYIRKTRNITKIKNIFSNILETNVCISLDDELYSNIELEVYNGLEEWEVEMIQTLTK